MKTIDKVTSFLFSTPTYCKFFFICLDFPPDVTSVSCPHTLLFVGPRLYYFQRLCSLADKRALKSLVFIACLLASFCQFGMKKKLFASLKVLSSSLMPKWFWRIKVDNKSETVFKEITQTTTTTTLTIFNKYNHHYQQQPSSLTTTNINNNNHQLRQPSRTTTCNSSNNNNHSRNNHSSNNNY